jgi:hypothetical protein
VFRRLRLALVLSLLMTLVVAPAAESGRRTCTRADIIVRLRLDEFRYDRDERVRMRLTTKNVSKRRCTMVWSDGEYASLVVRRDDGRRVWHDRPCALYTQAVVEERWPRGHKETYLGTWRQHTQGDPDTCENDGRMARRGFYSARGVFQGAGEVRSNRVWFRLTR